MKNGLKKMKNSILVPEGYYSAMIVDSSRRLTRRGSGVYVLFKFQILEGFHKGKHVYANPLISGKDEVAKKKGLMIIDDISRACGLLAINELSDLHHIPLSIKVKLVPANKDYPESNKIVTIFQKKIENKDFKLKKIDSIPF